MNNRVAGLTAGGVPETIASDSQITALKRKGHENQLKRVTGQTEPRPHLSPENGGQTKRATTMTAQEEQANKHD
jgi:hypothetical protein